MALRLKKDGGGKGRRSGLLLQSLTRFELGKSSSKTSNTSEDASSDPYEFVDSQSLQPHSPKTPRASVQPLSRTPLGSKRLRKSPASAQRKSPTELRDERLRRQEKEDMERAMEESRREATREERRQRRQKREEEAERVGQQIETSSRNIDEAIAVVTAAQTLTEPPVLTLVASSNSARESSDGFSQSTPPLSGARGNGVLHPSLSSSSPHTPVLQVTKLSHRLVVGRGGGDRDTTPLLSQEERGELREGEEEGKGEEEGGGEGEVGGERREEGETAEVEGKGEEKEAETRTPDKESQEAGSGKQKRHLLSLRRGKKRPSSDLSTFESLSPSSKKPRCDHSFINGGGVNEQSSSPHITPPSLSLVPQPTVSISPQPKPSPLGPTPQHTVARRTDARNNKQGNTELPDMFAPDGVPSAATILSVFNSYIEGLRKAQERVVSLVPWGKPIPSDQRQPLSSLNWRPGRRASSRGSVNHHNWPSIDINTGEIVRDPLCVSARRLGSLRSGRRASFLEEDDDDFLATPQGKETPSRPRGSLKDTERERKWFVPTEPPPTSQSGAKSFPTSPSPTPRLSPGKLHPLPGNFDPHTENTINMAKSTSGTPLASSSEVAVVPLPSSAAGDVGGEMMEVEDCQLTPAQDLGERGGKDGSLDCGEKEGGGEEWSGEEESADVASSTEAADDVITFRGRRKRRTNILDDSDSDAENDSNSSHTNDVICAKNNKRATEDVPGESKVESQSLFARALAAVGGGKRTKRKSFQPLSVRTVSSGRSRSEGLPQTVVELTEETVPEIQEKTGLGQQEEEEEEEKDEDGEGAEGEEKVSCPLCRKLFLCSLIESHAAGCGEPNEAGTGDVQRRRVSPHRSLRQSSLLTPRFSKAQPVLSQSPSSSDSQEISLSSTAPDKDNEEDNGVRMTTVGPRVVECEGGGYQVDPATISSSPIRTFRRITELDPQERADYYNQFNHRGSRGREGSSRSWGSAGVNSTRGRGRGKKGRGKRKFFRGRFRGRGKR